MRKLRSDWSCTYQIALALYQMALTAEAGHIQESREQIIDQMSDALHEAATQAEVTWSLLSATSVAARSI